MTSNPTHLVQRSHPLSPMSQVPPFLPQMFQISPFFTLMPHYPTFIPLKAREPPINRLPDEIFEHILSDAVEVPDMVFRRPSICLHGVLDPNFWQSSCILEVHSHWRRVGTPLVYRTVMLHSEAQSQALEVALLKHPEYIPSVKNFRINGPWTNLGTILSLCTQIRVLFMVLNIYHWNSVEGLCAGIPLINPVEVVLCSLEDRRKNANMRRVISTVNHAISDWTNLNTFTLPDDFDDTIPENVELVNALASCPSLRHIYTNRAYEWPKFWNSFVLNPGIRLHMSITRFHDPSEMLKELPIALQDRVHMFRTPWDKPSRERTVLVPSGPISLEPLLTQPLEVRCKILSHIFEYLVMPGVEPCIFDSVMERKIPTRELVSMRKNLLKTSTLFYFFALPLVYKVPLFTSPQDFFNLVKCVQTWPWLGFLISELTLRFNDFGLNHINAIEAHGVNESLRALLGLVRPLPGVTLGLLRFRAKSISISLQTLVALAGVAGNTLVNLGVPHVAPLGGFWLFRAQSHYSHVAVRTAPTFGFSVYPLPYFPYVQRLHFSLYDPAAIMLFTYMMWPSLKMLTMTGSARTMSQQITDFLVSHGAYLVELHIFGDNDSRAYEFCPRLRVLRLTGLDGILCPDFFQRFRCHPYLEHIIVDEYLSDYCLQRHPNGLQRKFFEELDFLGFPSMLTLKLKNYSWPKTDRDIGNAIMPQYAEKLADVELKKKAVKIMDKGGRTWRKRLPRP